MKRILFIFTFVFICLGSLFAQNSFKPLAKPATSSGISAFAEKAPAVSSSSSEISAFRFTGPIAGYMYPQNQVVTGIGYGYQRLHFVDSTQKYYTDFSVSGVLYAGGTVLPSLNPNNIISIGLSVGVLNQLINAGPAYNLPTKGKPGGSFGLVLNLSLPLNN